MFLTFRIDYRFLNIFWCLLCSLSFLSIFFVVLYLFYGPCCLILNKWMDGWITFSYFDHVNNSRLTLTLPSQYVCPSVRPSVTRQYSVETVTHILKLFSLSRSHTILIFFVPNGMAIFRRGLPDGGVECKGWYEKIPIFNQYRILSWKHYKIEP